MEQNIFSWIEKGIDVIWGKNGKQYKIESEVFFDEDEDKIVDKNERLSFNVVWIATQKEEHLIYIDEIEKLRHISDLSYDELKKLRSQIVLGSIYMADYRNTLGITAEEAYDYADGFEDFIYSDEEISKEEKERREHSSEEFADYCQSIEPLEY